MNIKSLIPMVNRIGQFFESQPNREEGVNGIANHIRLFWDPRMRRSLYEFLDQHPDGQSSDGALSEIVLDAVKQHREQLRPS
ncbi:formate dehydrogenase subunit delta [Paenalcaligenes niemegkensis]|uniref:formate dehydrogenase subunit delta n=1 Tax=Paenalcaligenes niemegkensis TaxID=2895469 RepID=UPI001EE7DA64|nr:formate dehydrogenase subunit delta [Paenalcaligenes niemegkensis]MCQ9617201.1 formate dehydrogenase subunit delta [Paenalcaligenes niemegkensis]